MDIAKCTVLWDTEVMGRPGIVQFKLTRQRAFSVFPSCFLSWAMISGMRSLSLLYLYRKPTSNHHVTVLDMDMCFSSRSRCTSRKRTCPHVGRELKRIIAQFAAESFAESASRSDSNSLESSTHGSAATSPESSCPINARLLQSIWGVEFLKPP